MVKNSEEVFLGWRNNRKVNVRSGKDYMDVTVSAETRHGHNRLDVILKRNSWSPEGLDICLQSHPPGLEVDAKLVNECLPHLIEALQGLLIWTPDEKPDTAKGS